MYQFIHVFYKNQFNFQIMLPRPKEDTRAQLSKCVFILYHFHLCFSGAKEVPCVFWSVSSFWLSSKQVLSVLV